MKLIQEMLTKNATLTGYLHIPSQEMDNIHTYPAVLILPGGGFRICSEREAEPIAMAFFAQGYQAFVLDYTTISKNKNASMADAMTDCNEAIAHIRSHCQEYDISEGQLAMIGFSGGGHLAAACATHGPNRPDALILGYPGIIHSDLRALDCPDIIESVDDLTLPCFLFSTRDDQVTPPAHILALSQALNEHNTDFELHIFRSGVHGLSLGNSLTCNGDKHYINDAFQSWLPMCLTWLKTQFGDFTIYGVNDGRTGTFSIDTPLAQLMKDVQAASLVKEAIPVAEQMLKNPMACTMTLRQASSHIPQLDRLTLQKLDQALLTL